ncbi:MAG: dihydrolipoamide acetyltransferase family protein [Burkholderiaceae bacterium]
MELHVIKMPDIGEGIAEVELVQWHVQPGESVIEDQLLVEVMTDKATVEIPSPVVGTVHSLGGEVGDILAVGSPLISIEVGDGHETNQAPSERLEPALASDTHSPPPPPVSQDFVQEMAIGVKASPAVRARAENLGIELRLVPGNGPAGRVTHADLDAYIVRRPPAPSPLANTARYASIDNEKVLPVLGLRRKIAQKMQEAKRRIPHFAYVEEVDVTELESLRAALNNKWSGSRGHLTLLPLLIRALVLALRAFPQINARFDDDAGVLTRFGAVHVGIATQTESGLMVPVLRHAEMHDLWSCAVEVARVAELARSGKGRSDELSGSTITITSLGALGGIVTTPIINYPEVAIVGINRIVQRPVILSGAVVARKMMNLSSSFDHRVIDGMVAAEFVQCMRAYLECPATLFIE